MTSSVDPLFVLRGHFSDATALAAHPRDPELLASGDADGTVMLWDLPLRRTILNDKASVSGILGVEFSPFDANALYIQGRDGSIQAWDLQRAAESGSFAASGGPSAAVHTGSFSFCRIAVPRVGMSCASEPGVGADGPGEAEHSHVAAGERHLVAACSDTAGVFDLWDMRCGERAVRCGGESTKALGLVMCLKLLSGSSSPNRNSSTNSTSSRNSSTDAACANDSNGAPLASLRVQPTGSSAPCLVPLAGYESGHAACFDLRRPSEPCAQSRLHTEPVTCLDLNHSRGAGGARVRGVCGGTSNAFVSFTAELLLGAADPAPQIAELKRVTLPQPGIADVAVRGDDRICALACNDHKVRVLNNRTGQQLAALRHHTAEVSRVVFTQDSLLCAASRDGTVSVWKVYPPQDKPLV